MTDRVLSAEGSERRCEILNAAFAVLTERGFAGMTMLAVARRAKASKETVYALFGSKEKLFEALVGGRSERMRAALIPAVNTDQPADPATVLTAFAIDFLGLITDPCTVAVHRLAIAEAERFPELGRIIDRSGRAPVRTTLFAYLERARAHGQLAFTEVEAAGSLFTSLLLGDLLICLLQNLIPTPTPAEIESRAQRAVAEFLRVYRSPPS